MNVLGTVAIEHVLTDREAGSEFLGAHGCIRLVSGLGNVRPLFLP